jgi:murein L,D-transpeptidase YcbB/YkuD
LLLPHLVLAAASDELRRQVEMLGESGGLVGSHPVENTAALVHLYGENQYRPLWFDDGPLAGQRADLLAEIEDSAGHGFNPGRYHYDTLVAAGLPAAELDLLYTDALLSQARHRYGGVISTLDEDWFLERQQLDAMAFARALLAGPGDLRQTLQALWPQHPQYRALLAKRAELAAQPDVFTQPVPPGPLLRPGHSGERVRQLQLRLYGPGAYSGYYDAELLQAVKEFQRDAGLEADGLVGPASLEILNADRFSWIDQVDANLERWRWLPRQIPPTYILVNIADFRLQVVDEGEPVLEMDVIVGRPYRSTPVFAGSLKYLVFYPYWNVPYSIAVKDKLPLLRGDPAAMAAAGYEVQLAGSEGFVPVTEVDWGAIRPGQFTLRQQPGDKNALGRVKFMLPNSHAVYLHDTPDKGLFNKSERVFSSGCIRLADPARLAHWVLDHDNHARQAEVDQLYRSGPTTTAYLSKPVPVLIVYFTAFLEEGEVVFRRDVYERDQGIIRQLRAGAP